jgi:hypothetical protein
MRAKLVILFLVSIALASGFAVRAAWEIDQANAAASLVASQRAGLEKATTRLQERLSAADGALAQLGQKAGQPSGEPGASVGANANTARSESSAKAEPPARRPSATTLIANDPRWLAEYLNNMRAGLELSYGGMFKALGLSPEQIARFEDAEVWLEETKMDLQATIDARELDPVGATCKKLWSDYEKSRVTKKAEVLGDLTNRYLEYFRTQGVRDYAQQLAWTGAFTSEPVTSAQVERVADILIANCGRRGGGSGPGWADPATINWSAASEQLKDLLSPTQISTLAVFFQRDKAQAKVTEQINRLTAQFKGRAPQ